MEQFVVEPIPYQSGSIIASRYEVMGCIGRGGMGWVFQVRDRQLKNQIVALKLLFPHLLADPAIFDRFRVEVLVNRELTHKNLVRIYDIGTAPEGHAFITMEFINGVTLGSLVRDDNLRFAEIVKILFETADGLAHAHEKGVIHRDLKPDNILISKQGEVKIADFGIARALWEESSATVTGQALGTPHYMAPEQIQGKGTDIRTDIYSFGIIAFELVSGRRPFDDESFYNLAHLHVHAPIPGLRGVGVSVDRWYEKLIAQACAKSPDDRFQSFGEIRELLHEKLQTPEIHHVDHRTGKAALSGTRERLQTAISNCDQAVTKAKRKIGSLLWAIVAFPWRFRLLRPILVPVLYYMAGMLILAPLVRNSSSFGKRAIVGILLFERFTGAQSNLVDWYKGAVDFSVRADRPEELLDAIEEDDRHAWALIAAGIDPNAALPVSGDTPLHLLVRRDQRGMVHHLLEQGLFGWIIGYQPPDPLTRNKLGQTAIHVALEHGVDNAILDTILTELKRYRDRHGSNASRLLTHADFMIADYAGNTPLHYAVRGRSPARMLEYLQQRYEIERREHLRDSDEATAEVWPEALDLQVRNHRGMTPLHSAIEAGSLKGVEILLQLGGEKLLRDVDFEAQRNALHVAIAAPRATLAERKPLLERLLQEPQGRDLVGRPDSAGITPLMAAVSKQQDDSVKMLLAKRPQDFRFGFDKQGRSALTYAILNDRGDIARELISEWRTDPSVQEMLARPDAQGQTPLILASKRGADKALTEFVSILRSLDAESETQRMIDYQDPEGMTALHHAVRSGNLWIATRLLEDGGADPALADRRGRRPLDLHPARNGSEIKARLERHLAASSVKRELSKSEVF